MLSTNVLIIGKSGVGKSSLINYIFDKELEETGAGSPVTKRGINEHNCQIDDDFMVNIYDTWGLEPGRNDAWKELIISEIEKHDALEINDWFHTIIYCINAGTNRIEDFELELLSSLVAEGNHIVVAFTHADVKGAMDAIDAFRNRLDEAELSKVDLVPVCSVQKKMIGGGASKAYGREEMLQYIRLGLWNKIIERLPKEAISKAKRQLELAKRNSIEYINNHINFGNIYSKKNYEEISAYVNETLENFNENVKGIYQAEIFRGFKYFIELSKKLMAINIHGAESEIELPEREVDFDISNGAKVANGVAGVTFAAVVPLAVLVMPVVMVKNQKERCAELVNTQIAEIYNQLEEDENMLRESLKAMLPEETFSQATTSDE